MKFVANIILLLKFHQKKFNVFIAKELEEFLVT